METRRFGKKVSLHSTRAIKHQVRRLQIEEEVGRLNTRVSEAIYAAEHMADQDSDETRGAYAHVSFLEEKIAGLTSCTSAEGLLARRGAIRAAVKSGNTERVDFLVACFTLESNDESQRAEFRALVP